MTDEIESRVLACEGRISNIETKTAVLENQVLNIDNSHKVTNKDLMDVIKGIQTDVKDIFEFINRSKGSIAALILGASMITGIIVAVLSWALTHFLK